MRVRLGLAMVMAMAVGCGDSHTPDDDDPGTDMAVTRDAAIRDASTGSDLGARDLGGGEVCGDVVCEPGTVCCNASCSWCAPPDVACTDIACEDMGTPCVECPAPPEGCNYVGGSCESCGELVCDEVACGGRLGMTCDAASYCDYDSGCGFADGTGICQPRPTGCPRDCPQVCGCDGNTYCNACLAASMGVDVLSDGPCGGDRCGGSAGVTCSRDEWCDFGGCPAPGESGSCEPRPEFCADVYAPVCGCDGRTYSNACEAASAGMNIASRGACGSDT